MELTRLRSTQRTTYSKAFAVYTTVGLAAAVFPNPLTISAAMAIFGYSAAALGGAFTHARFIHEQSCMKDEPNNTHVSRLARYESYGPLMHIESSLTGRTLAMDYAIAHENNKSAFRVALSILRERLSALRKVFTLKNFRKQFILILNKKNDTVKGVIAEETNRLNAEPESAKAIEQPTHPTEPTREISRSSESAIPENPISTKTRTRFTRQRILKSNPPNPIRGKKSKTSRSVLKPEGSQEPRKQL